MSKPNSERMNLARQIAAQCWCDEETKHITMDPALCEAIAKRFFGLMLTADASEENADFFRQMLDKCADNLGPLRDKAFIQDGEPIRVQIPILVAELARMVAPQPATEPEQTPVSESCFSDCKVVE